jgi:CheY-like chemotaxis protein
MNIKKKRILVVDDETNITTLLRLVFERDGKYEVRVENCPLKAMAVAESFLPDLVLMDVDMPAMQGGELKRRFNESSKLHSIPVMFLTGSVTKREAAQNDGMIGGERFLAKPLDRQELMVCLSEYFEKVSRRPMAICDELVAC